MGNESCGRTRSVSEGRGKRGSGRYVCVLDGVGGCWCMVRGGERGMPAVVAGCIMGNASSKRFGLGVSVRVFRFGWFG